MRLAELITRAQRRPPKGSPLALLLIQIAAGKQCARESSLPLSNWGSGEARVEVVAAAAAGGINDASAK